jgi:hypothetical protein
VQNGVRQAFVHRQMDAEDLVRRPTLGPQRVENLVEHVPASKGVAGNRAVALPGPGFVGLDHRSRSSGMA